MRRLTDERGAVAVVVAVLLVPLLGLGAVVIDVGAIYQERRELQNGADAAALAVADDCARGLPACAVSYVTGTAGSYADDNADDGLSAVDAVDLDLADGEVTVSTSTETSSGSEIAYGLASIFGDSGRTVTASARAAWGSPSSTVTVPLTIEECEFYKQPLDTPIVLSFHTGKSPSPTTTCAVNPAGQDGPGNFGWLETNGDCEAAVESGTAQGDTGTNPECSASELATLVGTTIAIPIYRQVTGTGSNLQYEIVGFGAFHLTGYRLGGGPEYNRPTPAPCNGANRCIAGYFTKFVTSVGEIDPDAPDFGLSVTTLVPIPA